MARRSIPSSGVNIDAEEDAHNRNNRETVPSMDEETDDDDHPHGIGTPAEAAPMGTDVYTTNARDGLNIRSGPGTDFPVVRSLPLGTRVHIVRREGRWGLIDEQGDGATDGFVHLAFLNQAPALDGSGFAATLAEDEVRGFWAARNPRRAKLYNSAGRPLVDPRLLHAGALGAVKLESLKPNFRIELYGPSGGFRASGSTGNHGAQAATGRGSAMDFVIIDRTTGRMLTNHPGRNHQNQGTVGENAPSYQLFYNEVVRAGLQIYPRFAEMARFGGYFKSGANAMDTMHIDMRGLEVPTAGGNLRDGFTREQIREWHIPENHPFR